MRKVKAEARREIDFSKAHRGPVIAPEPGKTKISIRLDNKVLEHFRKAVDAAGGGSYQGAINAALLAHIESASIETLLRNVIRDELGGQGRVAANRKKGRAVAKRPAASSARVRGGASS